MIVGVPREIKPGEQRVALTPAGAQALRDAGHTVLVEKGAGLGSGIRDDEYGGVGVELAAADEVWRRAELVLKVKEPVAEEYPRLRAGQICARPARSRSRTRRCSAPTARCRCSHR